MLRDIYIQQELQKHLSRRSAQAGVLAHELAELRRSRSLLRRSARVLGSLFLQIGLRLERFGAERLSSPVPPIIEFRIVK